MLRNDRHQFRVILECLIHADLPEKAAFPKPFFHQGRPFQQMSHIVGPATEVDDDPVLEGMMGDDVTRVGDDRVIAGQGIDDICLNREAFLRDPCKGNYGQDDDDHKWPREGIAPQFHKSLQSPARLPACTANPKASR